MRYRMRAWLFIFATWLLLPIDAIGSDVDDGVAPTTRKPITAGSMAEKCSTPIGSDKRNYCEAFLQGVEEGAVSMDLGRSLPYQAKGIDARILSIGAPVPKEMLVQAFLNFMRQHPEARDFSAASEVLSALIAEYGCANQSPKP